MPNLTEAEIMQKYRLPQEEVEKIKTTIIKALAKNIATSTKPLAIVVGGQSGSGKTALINYTSQMSKTREFVQIDNDFFRSFHPKTDEIRKLYPDFYTQATDQLGLEITADVIDYFRTNHYNIILHQTLKSNRVADDAIAKFKQAGYIVGVRAFAVPYFESKMSQIERCEGQLETLGFCRHVRTKDHDNAIVGLPQTINYIEQTGKYDFIEIFKRGEKISHPEVVYAKLNPETETETLSVLSDCENVLHKTDTFGFSSALEAVEKTRETEAVKLEKTINSRIEEAELNPTNNPEMQTHIDELKTKLAQFRQELTKK